VKKCKSVLNFFFGNLIEYCERTFKYYTNYVDYNLGNQTGSQSFYKNPLLWAARLATLSQGAFMLLTVLNINRFFIIATRHLYSLIGVSKTLQVPDESYKTMTCQLIGLSLLTFISAKSKNWLYMKVWNPPTNRISARYLMLHVAPWLPFNPAAHERSRARDLCSVLVKLIPVPGWFQDRSYHTSNAWYAISIILFLLLKPLPDKALVRFETERLQQLNAPEIIDQRLKQCHRINYEQFQPIIADAIPLIQH